MFLKILKTYHILFHTRFVCDQQPAAVLFLNPRSIWALR